MNRLPHRALVATLALILIAAAPAAAQLDTGSIVGMVRDQSSAVVPGATVTARPESTGTLVTATSSEKGQFAFRI
jgi:carboxypeptidase family protein